MKIHQLGAIPNVTFIGTDHMIRDQFGADGLTHFMEENGDIEIQSKQSLSNGKERKYSARQLGILWGEMLESLLAEESIRLGQMIHNYKVPGATSQNQVGIIDTLIDTIVKSFPLEKDENQEALLLGLGLIFGDDLDWSRSDSLVYAFQGRVNILVDGDKREISDAG